MATSSAGSCLAPQWAHLAEVSIWEPGKHALLLVSCSRIAVRAAVQEPRTATLAPRLCPPDEAGKLKKWRRKAKGGQGAVSKWTKLFIVFRHFCRHCLEYSEGGQSCSEASASKCELPATEPHAVLK